MAQVEMVLSFWLGPHDVAVLRGEQTSGTREVRFGHVGPLLRQFLYGVPKSGAEWKLPISPFEEKGIPAYELRVKCNPPSQERHGECTLPAQAANSRSPYPLWKDSVVPFAGEQPSQAIAIVRDEEDCFHLRLVGDAVHSHDAVMMDRHGAVCVGRDLLEAFCRLETMEHTAKVLLAARQLGQVRELPAHEAASLRALGLARYGGPPSALPGHCQSCSGCGRPSAEGLAKAAGFSVARITGGGSA